MRVVHVPFGYYPDAVGGTEAYVAELARGLRARGIDSVVAAPAATFARGCAANADWARAHWERDGPLTPARRAALSEAYAFAARQLALLDSGAFHRVASRGMSLGPDFLRQLPARLRWLSKLVGYERAESLAVRWRRARQMGSAPGVERP